MSTDALNGFLKFKLPRLFGGQPTAARTTLPEPAKSASGPTIQPAARRDASAVRRSHPGLVAALDIGSSKVVCFVARVESDGRLRVLGIGHQMSEGLKSGTVVDMDATEASILHAVHAAEEMSGETIRSVVVNVSGGHPLSRLLGVELDVSGHEIGDGDLRRALEKSRGTKPLTEDVEAGRRFIHSIPITYAIDGQRGIRDPRGMCGNQLQVSLHVVTADGTAVRNLAACIARTQLDVHSMVISPFASGLSALVEDEMELGVTLVDMGSETTTIAVFLHGTVLFTDVIRIGGHHVTKDIAFGLSTSFASAERLKTLYGNALTSPRDQRESIEVPLVGEEAEGHSKSVSRALLVDIIRMRLEETLELVRDRLEASGFDRIAGRRVVLTGGASQLPGLRELAGLVLDKQVRLGRPGRVGGLAEATGGPAFSTAAGLLIYARDNGIDARTQRAKPMTGIRARMLTVSDWLK